MLAFCRLVIISSVVCRMEVAEATISETTCERLIHRWFLLDFFLIRILDCGIRLECGKKKIKAILRFGNGMISLPREKSKVLRASRRRIITAGAIHFRFRGGKFEKLVCPAHRYGKLSWGAKCRYLSIVKGA